MAHGPLMVLKYWYADHNIIGPPTRMVPSSAPTVPTVATLAKQPMIPTALTTNAALAANFLIWYDLKPFFGHGVPAHSVQTHRSSPVNQAVPIFRKGEVEMEIRTFRQKLGRKSATNCIHGIGDFIQ